MRSQKVVEEGASFHPEVSFRVNHFFSFRTRCGAAARMRIGELAELSGLSREALRFYEQRGLIRARRQANGYRDYPPEAVMLVQYIRTAQQLGFTLAEIGERLPQLWDAPDPAPALAAVLAHKLTEIDARIAALTELRTVLAGRIALACPLEPG